MTSVLYSLLDAARMGEAIDEAKKLNPDHTILYSGRSATVLTDYAPYLFSFDTVGSFNDWYFSRGWGDSWGIICRTNVAG